VNNIFCLPAGLHQEFILPQHCVSSHRRDNPAPNKIRWKFERGTSFGIGIFQLPDITLQCWRHWHFRFRFKIKKAAVVHPLSTSMCRDHPSLSPTPCNSFSRDKIPRRASRDSGTIGASTKVDSVPEQNVANHSARRLPSHITVILMYRYQSGAWNVIDDSASAVLMKKAHLSRARCGERGLASATCQIRVPSFKVLLSHLTRSFTKQAPLSGGAVHLSPPPTTRCICIGHIARLSSGASTVSLCRMKDIYGPYILRFQFSHVVLARPGAGVFLFFFSPVVRL